MSNKEIWEVEKVKPIKHSLQKEVIVFSRAKESNLPKRTKRKKNLIMHKGCLVGPNDLLHLDKEKIFVCNREDPSERILLNHNWSYSQNLTFGGTKLKLKIEVLKDIKDQESYELLSEFHYRTHHDRGFDAKAAGRSSALVLKVTTNGIETTVGYIELQMPVMMCKPRHLLFANPYKNLKKNVSWSKWDAEARKSYVNLIVRIGRVVVHPEWRGLNLAKILIEASKDYASKYWHSRGKSPVFMEISAQMLKHMDFVSSSGFSFIGNTEGNLARVALDLKYINRGYESKGGVMSMQKKYLKEFKRNAHDLGIPFSEALKELENICQNPKSLEDLSHKKWLLYKSAIRLPIPYYLLGLDTYSKNYIKNNINKKKRETKKKAKNVENEIFVEMKDVALDIKMSIPSTAMTRYVTNSFGIKKRKFNTRLIKPLKSLKLKSGQILFISGSSGSGKSIFLELFDNKSKLHKNFYLQGKISYSKNYKVGWMKDIRSKQTLLDLFSKKFGTEQSIHALNLVGLSEAFVYLKTFDHLSEGQKYRAKIAKMVLEGKNVWLIDEYCSDLDPISAKIVSMNLRTYISKQNIILIAAAANNSHFLKALNADKVLKLSAGGAPAYESYKR